MSKEVSSFIDEIQNGQFKGNIFEIGVTRLKDEV
jgi:hypothetical protein